MTVLPDSLILAFLATAFLSALPMEGEFKAKERSSADGSVKARGESGNVEVGNVEVGNSRGACRIS